ncbi:MAG: translation initiation factor IF-2 [Clostridia bacterium]|nr:translation initiation factor IF-2 [Clostridia bacterium]
MAINQKPIKINTLARDFNIKSKDVIEILASVGIDKKTSGTIDANEYALFLSQITESNQVSNITDYINGKTELPKAPEKKPEQKTTKPKSTADSAKTASAKPVQPKETAAKEAPEAKPVQPKEPAVKEAPEAKPVQLKEPAVKEAPEAKSVQPKESAMKEAPEAKSVQPKEPVVKEVPEVKPAQAKETPTKEPVKEMAKKENTNRFNQTAKPASERTERTFASDDMKHTERPAQNRTPAVNNNRQDNSDRRQPVSQQKTQEQNRQQFGQRMPSSNNNQRTQQPRQNTQQNHTPSTLPQNHTQPVVQQNTQPAPRPIPQPQPQKPKEKKEQQPIAPKTTRIVDTRTTSVDLSKYDERLENFVPESARRNNAPDRQKLKKQQTHNPYAKGSKDKSKNAPDKLKKQEVKKQQLSITIPDEIVVSDLAVKLKVTASEVIKRLMMMGVMATVNQVIDYDTAFFVADELGAKVTKEVVVTIEEKLFDEETDDADALETRSPVVCVMGHVDHGKTSLLDAIRNTHVTAGEAGGITQHIGAYRVNCNDQYITFLDTPGHEAFTAMRARGAKSTDIAILVVAADDGIMPQTVEAINHAKAANIPIIVAINKIDKPTANPESIKSELTKYDLVPEEWGGDIICCPVSALTGKGIPDLLESVLLVAEVEDFKANPNRRAKGIVIEAKLDKGRGPVASVLVQNGTLHTGDTIIVGTAVGRVRAMTNDKGKVIKEAGPSVPVEIIGLDSVPSAGDELNAVEDERMAKELAEQRRQKEKEEIFKANAKVNLDDLFAQMAGGVKDLNIIVKADVKGSAEAVKASLEKLTNEEVKVNVIHTGVGGIIEGDVMLAAASNAIIVGFNVRPDKTAIDSAELQGVDIRTYRIIYECIEEIEAAIKGMLKPVYKEVILGHAEVRQTIHVPNVGFIAGSYITDGKVTRTSQIRVIRDGVIIFEDKIASLRRFKDDVKEVASGYECGIGLDKFNDIKENDVLEAFVMEQVER